MESYRELWQSLKTLSDTRSEKIYLVGGAVRDILLGREGLDIDLVVKGKAMEFARQWAISIGGSFVPLDQEHCTARVVVKNEIGTSIWDLTRLRGDRIEDDLKERDFTINAMAIDLNDLNEANDVADDQLIDPYEGLSDLKRGIIRIISPQALVDDPLRLLRAVRLAATFKFEIEPDTLRYIRQLAPLLSKISAERIRDELFKILAVDDSYEYIAHLDSLGLLTVIIPEIEDLRDLKQGGYHHLSAWGHSLLALEEWERLRQELSSLCEDDKQTKWIYKHLSERLAGGRRREALLKFGILLHDIGKPLTRIEDEEGRIKFTEHEKIGSDIAAKITRRLRLSSKEVKILRKVVRGHMYPLHLSLAENLFDDEKGISPSSKAIARFCRKMENESLDVILLSLADGEATRGPLVKEEVKRRHRLLAKRVIAYCYEMENKKDKFPKLISGKDLIDEFKLESGPLVGVLLGVVEQAQLEGMISSREEALNLVRETLGRE